MVTSGTRQQMGMLHATPALGVHGLGVVTLTLTLTLTPSLALALTLPPTLTPGAMRRLEACGVPSAFPHPSQLYEQLLSKQWQAALCLSPQYRLPPTTALNRALVAAAPRRAAHSALAALAALRAAAGGGSTGGGAPHLGVIKLGYAWEATQVLGVLGVLGVR